MLDSPQGSSQCRAAMALSVPAILAGACIAAIQETESRLQATCSLLAAYLLSIASLRVVRQLKLARLTREAACGGRTAPA